MLDWHQGELSVMSLMIQLEPLHPVTMHQFVWDIPVLIGGFNPSEKYSSKWKSSPGRGENKTYLKPPSSCTQYIKSFSRPPKKPWSRPESPRKTTRKGSMNPAFQKMVDMKIQNMSLSFHSPIGSMRLEYLQYIHHTWIL